MVKAQKREDKQQIREIKSLKKDVLKSDKRYRKIRKREEKKGGKDV